MAGTQDGGRKAAASNKVRYGEDFYRNIGRRGGAISQGGGFAANRELASTAGAKGGRASRRRTMEQIAKAKSEGPRHITLEEEVAGAHENWLKRVFK